ncbi:hypothetical protein HDU96_008334 [Phlyctochytrium bullatum]|nr:hypothetical protein HDU96_008334 [Phlyctochytrium bullatum]
MLKSTPQSDKSRKRAKATKAAITTRQQIHEDIPSSYTDPDFTNLNNVALNRFKRNHEMIAEVLGLAPAEPIKRAKLYIKYTQSDIDRLQAEIEAVKAEHAEKMARFSEKDTGEAPPHSATA